MKKINIKKISILVGICVIVFVAGIIWGRVSNRNHSDSESKDTIYTISNLEDIYSAVGVSTTPLTSLDKEYSMYDAIEDGHYVVSAKTYNYTSVKEFIDAYKENKKAFVRIVQLSTEGDLIIYDLAYIPGNKKVYVIKDCTRDKFASVEDRAIEYEAYDSMESEYKGSKCLVVYNGINIENVDDNNIKYIVSL